MKFTIQLQRKGKAEFFVVLVKLFNRDDWIFLRSFYTFNRAQNFIESVKADFAKGNYECLTLKN